MRGGALTLLVLIRFPFGLHSSLLELSFYTSLLLRSFPKGALLYHPLEALTRLLVSQGKLRLRRSPSRNAAVSFKQSDLPLRR